MIMTMISEPHHRDTMPLILHGISEGIFLSAKSHKHGWTYQGLSLIMTDFMEADIDRILTNQKILEALPGAAGGELI